VLTNVAHKIANKPSIETLKGALKGKVRLQISWQAWLQSVAYPDLINIAEIYRRDLGTCQVIDPRIDLFYRSSFSDRARSTPMDSLISLLRVNRG